MKRILTILFILAGQCTVRAQNKEALYVDIALTNPGISATYDRKIMKHIDLGLGLSAYDFSASYGNVRAAFYADIRPYLIKRRNLFFLLADVGLAVNGGQEPADGTMSPAGLYTTVGFGYCYQINKRGWGPYATLSLNGATESVRYRDPLPPPQRSNYTEFDGYGVLSVGFKF